MTRGESRLSAVASRTVLWGYAILNTALLGLLTIVVLAEHGVPASKGETIAKLFLILVYLAVAWLVFEWLIVAYRHYQRTDESLSALVPGWSP